MSTTVTSLLVADDHAQLVGIVSEADLLVDILRPDPRKQMLPREHVTDPLGHVADVMTLDPLTVTPDTDLVDAIAVMTSTAAKSMPVLRDNEVVGVVSRSDIVHMLALSNNDIHAAVDESLRSAGIECEFEVDDGVVILPTFDDPAQQRIAEVIANAISDVVSVRSSRHARSSHERPHQEP